MGRRTVEVVIDLLDVLAVIAFRVRQAVQALFEDRIAPVPQRQSQTEPLVAVAKSGDAVFAPAIGAAAGMIVREIFPGVPVLAVILSDRAPLPLADKRP